MSKSKSNLGANKGSSSKPSSASSPKSNPNYPSTTGNKSGKGRGNTPK
ncbi:hypothetical protein [Flavobacterium sp.]|nr:hypothetical protein [Flavobacterium sp.]